MSELKAIHAYTLGEVETICNHDDGDEYYLKSEADKVIADLEESHKKEVEQLLMEIAELKAQKAQAENDCAYWKMCHGNAENAMHETEEYAMQLYNEARHSNRKRCLAMAKACHEKSERMYCESSTAKSINEIIGKEPKDAVVEKFELWGSIASTHCKRLLELAEKFKEAK